jgi:hypothetical protein
MLTSPLQMSFDAGHQLLRLERFGDVLVGPLFHTPEPVAVLGFTCDQNDLDAAGRLTLL